MGREREKKNWGENERERERTRKEAEISQQFAVKKKEDRQHYFLTEAADANVNTVERSTRSTTNYKHLNKVMYYLSMGF